MLFSLFFLIRRLLSIISTTQSRQCVGKGSRETNLARRGVEINERDGPAWTHRLVAALALTDNETFFVGTSYFWVQIPASCTDPVRPLKPVQRSGIHKPPTGRTLLFCYNKAAYP